MIATPGTVTRSYKGSLPKATEAFQRDAVAMAQSEWFPTSQTYAPGSWGCGAFLVALLLWVLVVGFFIFIYMLVVKPDGQLVVTYEYRGSLQVPVAAAANVATGEGWR